MLTGILCIDHSQNVLITLLLFCSRLFSTLSLCFSLSRFFARSRNCCFPCLSSFLISFSQSFYLSTAILHIAICHVMHFLQAHVPVILLAYHQRSLHYRSLKNYCLFPFNITSIAWNVNWNIYVSYSFFGWLASLSPCTSLPLVSFFFLYLPLFCALVDLTSVASH